METINPAAKPSSVRLPDSTLETLEHLFTTVPPHELRENLLELYHSYLMHCDGNLPINFDQISRNMYHLIHCLPDINLGSND
jgi:hypothetical protein